MEERDNISVKREEIETSIETILGIVSGRPSLALMGLEM